MKSTEGSSRRTTKTDTPIFAYSFPESYLDRECVPIHQIRVSSLCDTVDVETKEVRPSLIEDSATYLSPTVECVLLTLKGETQDVLRRQSHSQGLNALISSLNICSKPTVTFSSELVNRYRLRQRENDQPSHDIFTISKSEKAQEQEIEIDSDFSQVFRGIVGASEVVSTAARDRPRAGDTVVGESLYRSSIQPPTGYFTLISNFWFIAENMAFSDGTDMGKLSENLHKHYDISKQAAMYWYSLVNRIKHPDKGDRGRYIWNVMKSQMDISIEEGEFSVEDNNEFDITTSHKVIQEILKKKLKRYSEFCTLSLGKKNILGLKEEDEFDPTQI